MSKENFWSQEFGEEWVNFTEGVPVDIVIEDAEPEEVETTWGLATIIRVWQYNQGVLTGGIRKQLRINSRRLCRGLRNASPGGIPAKGNGYRLIRSGEGWATSYNVTWIGKWKVLPQGERSSVDTGSASKLKKLD